MLSEAMNTTMEIVETESAGCRKLLRDVRFTVIIPGSGIVVSLPENAWSDSELQCGSLTDLLQSGRPSKVICWGCARRNGFVDETEAEHHADIIERRASKIRW
jgi:hypothetical protein